MGVWSIGFLTSDGQIGYFGYDQNDLSAFNSEVLSYQLDANIFYGFEAYVNDDEQLLASIGAIEVNNACLTGFKESMHPNFQWLIATQLVNSTLTIDGESYDMKQIFDDIEAVEQLRKE